MTEIFTETTENDKGLFDIDKCDNNGCSILYYLISNNIPYFSIAKTCADTKEKILCIYTNNKDNDILEFVYNVKPCEDGCEQLTLLTANKLYNYSSINDLLYRYALKMINQSECDGDDIITEIVNKLK